jgi:hypothetical protein
VEEEAGEGGNDVLESMLLVPGVLSITLHGSHRACSEQKIAPAFQSQRNVGGGILVA